MKRPDRFFVADLAALTVGETLELDPREAAHASRVKRHRTGDRIELFDGRGLVARAAVTATDPRRGVTVRLTESESAAPPAGALCLATAVPRGDRMESLVETACQLGVARIAPIVFERSTPGTRGRSQRWQRVAIEACKQSGRNHFPRIDEPAALADWLASKPPAPAGRWLADPGGAEPAALAGAARRGPCVALVGPEGGLTRSEFGACLAAGFSTVRLGDHILRIETAAMAVGVVAMLPGASPPATPARPESARSRATRSCP